MGDILEDITAGIGHNSGEQVVSLAKVQANVLSIIGKFADDDGVNQLFEAEAKRKEMSQTAPLQLMILMQRTMGKDIERLREYLGEGEKFSYLNEAGDTKTGHVIDIIAGATARGKVWKMALEGIKEAKAKAGAGPEPWNTMDKGEVENEYKLYNQRWNTVKQSTRKAIALHFQFIDFNSKLSHVQAKPVIETKEGVKQLKACPTPIYIIGVKDESEGKRRDLSVTQFLTVDIDKALEKGGTFAAVMGSFKRNTDGKQKTEGNASVAVDGVNRIQKVEQYESTIAETTAYELNEDNWNRLLKRLAETNADGTPKHADLILSIGDHMERWDSVWSKGLNTIYEKLAFKRLGALEAEAAKAKVA